MSISVSDNNVVALLASLGFDDGRLGNQAEVVIDKFDQWTNADTAALLATTCTCTVTVDFPTEAAA